MRLGFLAWILAFGTVCTAQAQLLSPGDLSKVHKELDSDRKCTLCHGSGAGGGRTMDNLCTDCHTDIGTQRQRNEGLHSTEFKGNCGHCHVEHRGRNHDLVRWPGGSQESFDHKITGFTLDGAHADATCRDCHNRKRSTGSPTFLGLNSSCASCHKKDDAHDGRFGENCQTCHNSTDWNQASVEDLNHDLTRFPLKGSHMEVKCAECHGEPPKYTGLDFDSCNDCHEDPHQGRLGEECARCHQEKAWNSLVMLRSEHPGIAITAGHAKAQCRDCHDQGNMRPPRVGSRCVDCHNPVHDADFGNNCKQCHADIRWLGLPDQVGRNAHGRTPFPLEGQHQTVGCAECHTPSLPQAQRYRGLQFEQCRDCHEDVHGGKLSRFGNGDCATCHAVQGFRPTLFGPQGHAETAFPLEGRHAAVPCFACHTGEPPRYDWSVQKQECIDCHENPHGNQFAQEMAQGGCAHCHSPVDWHQPKIDHSIWPLTGAHELTACASCHGDAAEGAERGRVDAARYRGLPRECEGCHRDPHLGQFVLTAPERTCNECHNTTEFLLPDFDHAQTVEYPLVGKHAQLECNECHEETTLRNGDKTTRYRLGYRDCRSCHADPHGSPQ